MARIYEAVRLRSMDWVLRTSSIRVRFVSLSLFSREWILCCFCRCEHYRRRCKIVACNQVLPCRHCHNEATVSSYSSPSPRRPLLCCYGVHAEQYSRKLICIGALVAQIVKSSSWCTPVIYLYVSQAEYLGMLLSGSWEPVELKLNC